MPQGLQVFRPDASLMLDVTERLGRVLGTISIASNTTGGSTGNQVYTISGIPSGNTLWVYATSLSVRDMAVFPTAANSYSGLVDCPVYANSPAAGQINYQGGYGGWVLIYGIY